MSDGGAQIQLISYPDPRGRSCVAGVNSASEVPTVRHRHTGPLCNDGRRFVGTRVSWAGPFAAFVLFRSCTDDRATRSGSAAAGHRRESLKYDVQ